MAISPLKKLVLVPFLVSAAVFSTLTLPLALLGSKPVVIRLQEEPVFDGRLRDIATPYLGLAGLLSLGAGIASVAVTGWRQSSLKSAQFEQQLIGIQQHLKEKEELLKELRLSESRLEASGLNIFLDEETESKEAVNLGASAIKTANVQVEQSGIPNRLAETSQKAQAAASVFQSAQPFLGFAQANPLFSKPTVVATVTTKDSTAALLPVEELQSQIKQLMTQIEALQSSLQTTPQQATSEANQAISPVIHPHQTQIVESWLMHKVAS